MNSSDAISLPGPAAAPRRKFQIDTQYLAPLLVTAILLTAQLSAHVLVEFQKTALAILTSITLELILGKLFNGKWPRWASAYISGISVGILVRSAALWPYVFCSAVSITSKYVIRINGRHIWNPSNLGIVALLVLAPQYASTLDNQFGNALLPVLVIWVIGSFIISRLRLFHICFTYASCFIGFAFLRSVLLHDSFAAEVAPITGPMYQLFTFFMITDPKTIVASKKGQIFVTFLIAFLENLFRMYGSIAMPAGGSLAEIVASHAPFFALTIIGPMAIIVEAYKIKRSDRISVPAQ